MNNRLRFPYIIFDLFLRYVSLLFFASYQLRGHVIFGSFLIFYQFICNLKNDDFLVFTFSESNHMMYSIFAYLFRGNLLYKSCFNFVVYSVTFPNEMNAQSVPIVPTSDKNGSTYYRPHPVSNRCSLFVTSHILSILLFAQVTDFYVKANRIRSSDELQ